MNNYEWVKNHLIKYLIWKNESRRYDHFSFGKDNMLFISPEKIFPELNQIHEVLSFDVIIYKNKNNIHYPVQLVFLENNKINENYAIFRQYTLNYDDIFHLFSPKNEKTFYPVWAFLNKNLLLEHLQNTMPLNTTISKKIKI